MLPKISVIIPLYNAEDTIADCLESVFNSQYKNFEVIVIDDKSTDNSVKVAKKFPIKLIKLNKNSGPGHARNVGIVKAKGDLIFFIDSDVTINSDVFGKIIKNFKNNKNIGALILMRSKHPLNKGLVPHYWALYKYYLWSIGKGKYQTSFTTNRGVIKKSIFEKMGGFDKKYKNADVEDYDYGYRLSDAGYKILVDKSCIVHHSYPTFEESLKKFFRRSFMWIRLFLKRKKFDKMYTTSSMAYKTIAAFSTMFFLFAGIVLPFLWVLALFSLVIFIFLSAGFYSFVLKEQSNLLIPIIFVDYLLSFVIGLGAALSIVVLPFEMLFGKKMIKGA